MTSRTVPRRNKSKARSTRPGKLTETKTMFVVGWIADDDQILLMDSDVAAVVVVAVVAAAVAVLKMKPVPSAAVAAAAVVEWASILFDYDIDLDQWWLAWTMWAVRRTCDHH